MKHGSGLYHAIVDMGSLNLIDLGHRSSPREAMSELFDHLRCMMRMSGAGICLCLFITPDGHLYSLNPNLRGAGAAVDTNSFETDVLVLYWEALENLGLNTKPAIEGNSHCEITIRVW